MWIWEQGTKLLWDGRSQDKEYNLFWKTWQESPPLAILGLCQETAQENWPLGRRLAAHFLDEACYQEAAPQWRGWENEDPFFLELWEGMKTLLEKEVLLWKGFRFWIKAQYPQWEFVGQLHFHLAERSSPQEPFAFLASCGVRSKETWTLQHKTLQKVFHENPHWKIWKVLKDVLQESSWARDFSEKLWSPFFMTALSCRDFLSDMDVFEKNHVVVKFPKSWEGKPPSRGKLSLRIHSPSGEEPSLGFRELVRCRLICEVDGEQFDVKSLGEGLIYLRGRWVNLDKVPMEKILHHWEKLCDFTKNHEISLGQALEFFQRARREFSKEMTLSWEGSWEPLSQKELNLLPKKDLKGFQGNLKPYQEEGVAWLISRSELGVGGCLADQMGLGKTLQILSLLCYEQAQERGKNLIVTPPSLLGHWEQEIHKFFPHMSYEVIHKDPSFSQKKLIITTYGLTKNHDFFSKTSWNVIIFDEAQILKNSQTQIFQAISLLKRRVAFLVTGTPVENSLMDLWALFQISCPGLLGSQDSYLKNYDDGDFSHLKETLEPYLLRRVKEDVLKDLPSKNFIKVDCPLSQKQVKAYGLYVEKLKKDLSQKNHKGLILKSLMALKQICNHPSQYYGDEEFAIKDSGKFIQLKKLCEKLAAQGESVLVFTQFQSLTKILTHILKPIFPGGGDHMDGRTSHGQRSQKVLTFQKNSKPSFLVLSLKVGGVGLNLTAANHVIHFDRWWNPAVEAQATDRVHRLGQKNPVTVHAFLCPGTLEERIHHILEKKALMAEKVLKKNSPLSHLWNLNSQEFIDLVTLDKVPEP